MPILDINDSRLSGLQLSQGLVSSLPPASAGFSAIADFARGNQYLRDTLSNYGRINQLSAGSALVSVGAPQGDYSIGDQLWDGLIGIVQIEDSVTQILNLFTGTVIDAAGAVMGEVVDAALAAMADILDEVFNPLMDVVAAIPIFGWVVDTIWNVAVGIFKLKQLIDQMNAPPPEKESDPAYFFPDDDRNIANDILTTLRTSTDWTALFMPPGTGKAYNWGEAFYAEKLTKGVGRRFFQTGRIHHPEYVGYIPGAGTLEQGFEIYEGKKTFTRNLGELYPTPRNLCTTVWTQVNRVSPAMFTVDAERAARAWRGHLFDMRLFLHEWENKEGMTRTDAKDFVNGLGMRLFGWKNWDQGKASFEGDGIDPFGLDSSIPVMELRILRDRQLGYLNQSVVAYVDESFPAISGYYNDELKARWETNRQKLLTHKARCDIDRTSIPDPSYRSQMTYAKESCDPPGQFALVSRPPPLNPPEPVPTPRPLPSYVLSPYTGAPAQTAPGKRTNPLLLLLGAAGLLWGGSTLLKARK